MLRGFLFLAILSAFVVFALKNGENDERQMALALLFASVATLVAVLISNSYFTTLMISVFVVDTLFFGFLMVLAICSKKYWPLWTAALQLINVSVHLAIMLVPEVVPKAYSMLQGVWSYFQMAIVSFAIVNIDRKRFEQVGR